MIAMYAKEIMQYAEKDMLEILRFYEKTEETAKEDVKTIKNWLKTQHHLPEITDDEIILRFLCINEFSIERTKEKLEFYYRIRNFTPEPFSRHPLNPEMLEAYKQWHFVTLPKLLDLNRVVIFKLIDNSPENCVVEYFYNHLFNFAEVRLLYDFCINDIIVLELSNAKMAHLLKISPTLLYKVQIIVQKLYLTRVKAIHVINGFEVGLNMIKAILPFKLHNRLYIHNSYASLYEYIPRDILPKDLGGDEKSLIQLSEIQLKCFEEMKSRFDVLIKMKCNEELRPEISNVNDEIFGFYGNFRKLEVD